MIARKDEVIVFFEIKFRSRHMYGNPLEAVDMRKQRRISRTALYYTAYQGQDRAYRFDVIGIEGDGTVLHIENAFDFCG